MAMILLPLSCFVSLQAIGYFIAIETEKRNPPLVFVLSKKSVSLILFPFQDEKDCDLINAIVVPWIPLWTGSSERDAKGRLNTALIGALFAFSIGRVTPIPYPKKLGDTTLLKKTFKKSEVDELRAQLREKDMELNELRKKKNKELKKLQKEKDKELRKKEEEIKEMEEKLKKQDEKLEEKDKKV